MTDGNFEIRDQVRRMKVFYKGRYVAAFNENMWRPYVFPLCTPKGFCMLQEASVDHPFHNGIFFAHDKVSDKVNTYTFWIPLSCPSYVHASGRIICRDRKFTVCGDTRLDAAEQSEWLDPRLRVMMAQDTTYELACLETVNAIRIRTKLTARMDLILEQAKEAFLGVRIADQFVVHNGGRIVDADGNVNEEETFNKTSAWVDYQGFTAGLTAGIAVCQPRGREPIPWFTRDYGFVGVNQFREGGPMELKENDTYELDVLVAAHDGDHTNPELQGLISV